MSSVGNGSVSAGRRKGRRRRRGFTRGGTAFVTTRRFGGSVGCAGGAGGVSISAARSRSRMSIQRAIGWTFAAGGVVRRCPPHGGVGKGGAASRGRSSQSGLIITSGS
jgi:hypothetical protein